MTYKLNFVLTHPEGPPVEMQVMLSASAFPSWCLWDHCSTHACVLEASNIYLRHLGLQNLPGPTFWAMHSICSDCHRAECRGYLALRPYRALHTGAGHHSGVICK